MSKATKPTDEVYFVEYLTYRTTNTALVIASNPIQARNRLEDKLTDEQLEGFKLDSVRIKGVLRDRVKEAQDNGVAAL